VPLFPPRLCYISPIFLVPKKSGGMRPILNLKKLNAAHLNTPYFRMETVEDVRQALRPGHWAASIDLRYFLPPPFHKKIHVLQMERPPLPFLHAPLRPITSSKGLHSPHQIHQAAFPVRASGSGWPAAILPLFSVLRRMAREILIYSLVKFSSPFQPVGRTKGKISTSVSSSFLVGIEAPISTGLPLAVRPCF
jgi:hypothetical protein